MTDPIDPTMPDPDAEDEGDAPSIENYEVNDAVPDESEVEPDHE